MNTKTLGLIGMISSPFLAVDFIFNSVLHPFHPNTSTGVYSFIYMTGWLGCMVALYSARASGYRTGSIILLIQMGMLLLAEGWNIYMIVQPEADTILKRIVDAFWPISNCFMIVTGIAIVKAKVLQGWRRYIPLIVGLWLPFSGLTILIIGKDSLIAVLSSGAYSTIAWFLLGLSVYVSANRKVSFRRIGRYVYKPA